MKKILFVLLFGIVSNIVSAQVFDLKSIYSVTSDTVINTGTVYITTPVVSPAPATTTTIWVNVTKISGIVGGTITLQGSIDGTNFKALNAVNSTTALATHTATDASNTYHWIISGSPMRYYRVSWTGTGTMSAKFSAQMFRSK